MTTNTDQRTSAPGTDQRPQPRIAAGPLGRALYLSDLVRWLMRKHEATRAQVVNEHLCPVLLEHGPALYGVWDSGDTTALSDMEWFRSGSGNCEVQQTERPRMLSRGIGYPVNSRPKTPSLGRGLEGAVAWLRGFWGNVNSSDAVTLDDWKRAVAARMAVSEADARRCWGWGADAEAEGAAAEPASVFPLADSAALVAYRKDRKTELVANGKPRQGVAWKTSDPADNQLQVLHRWHEALGGNEDAAGQIAKALGCTRQAVNAALVKDYDKGQDAMNTVAQSLSASG